MSDSDLNGLLVLVLVVGWFMLWGAVGDWWDARRKAQDPDEPHTIPGPGFKSSHREKWEGGER